MIPHKKKVRELDLEQDEHMFSKDQINFLYEKFIQKKYDKVIIIDKSIENKEIVRILLNKLLEEMNIPSILFIEDFKIEFSELKKINGEQFVKNNISLFDKLGLGKKELNYNSHKILKHYIVVVLKLLVELIDYRIVKYVSTKNKKTVTKVCFKKSEE